METLYDYDKDCNSGRACPKFVFYKKTNRVVLIDRKGKSATMKMEEFNDFIDSVVKGKVKKISK